MILIDLKRPADAKHALETALALPDTARHHGEFRQRGTEALGRLLRD